MKIRKITGSNPNMEICGKDQERISCLLLLPRKLFPAVSGYSNKNRELLPYFSKRYQVTVIVFSDSELSEEEKQFYASCGCEVYVMSLGKRERAIGVLKALLLGWPVQVGLYYSRRAGKFIEKKADDKKIVIASLVRTVEYTKHLTDTQVKVFDMVDSVGLNYKNSWKKTGNKFWRCVYRFEYPRLLRYENRFVKNSDCTFFVNRLERDYYRTAGKTVWAGHGVKEELFYYDKKIFRKRPFVAFIGKMNYEPNIEAVLWYVKNVHCAVGEEISFVIVGANPSEEIRRLPSQYSGIEVTGYCEDPYIFLNSAMAVIAPMRTGGGIQNKVLEGMALGKINLISSLAAAPIYQGVSGRDFLTADSPEEYTKLLREIKENPREFLHIGKNGRDLARRYFSWKTCCDKYGETLDVLVREKEIRSEQ